MKALKLILVFLALAISAAAIVLFLQSFNAGHRGDETDGPATAPVTGAPGTDAPATRSPETNPVVTRPVVTAPAVTTKFSVETQPAVTGPAIREYEVPVTMYAIDDGINIRMGPSTQDNRYGQLSKGDAVTVTGKTDTGWYRIVYHEIYQGYVYGTYLTISPVDSGVKITTYDAPVTRYATQDVNVRANYSTNSSKLGLLKAGASVAVTGTTSNGWSVVVWEGNTAYISSTYLTDQAPAVTTEATPGEN